MVPCPCLARCPRCPCLRCPCPRRAGTLGLCAPDGGGQRPRSPGRAQAAARPQVRGLPRHPGAGVGAPALPPPAPSPDSSAPGDRAASAARAPPGWVGRPRLLVAARIPADAPDPAASFSASGGTRRRDSSRSENREVTGHRSSALTTGEGAGKSAAGRGEVGGQALWLKRHASSASSPPLRPSLQS